MIERVRVCLALSNARLTLPNTTDSSLSLTLDIVLYLLPRVCVLIDFFFDILKDFFLIDLVWCLYSVYILINAYTLWPINSFTSTL
jgi:hypothetical protein